MKDLDKIFFVAVLFLSLSGPVMASDRSSEAFSEPKNWFLETLRPDTGTHVTYQSGTKLLQYSVEEETPSKK